MSAKECIVIQPQLGDTIRVVREVMLRLNEPKRWFRRGRDLLRLTVHSPELRDADKVPFSIEIENRDTLTGELSRHVEWLREGKGGLKSSGPPKDAILDVCKNPDARLPELEAVLTSPFFSPSRLVVEEGYHEDQKVLLVPPRGFSLAAVDSSPEAVAEALRFLGEELLGDFPFADEAGVAHAIAAMLVPMTRRMYRDSPTPLFAISADKPGSGKTLLANVISLVATGRTPPPTTMSFGGAFNDAETRRQLTAVLSRLPETVLIDNVREHEPIDSPSFAAVLTARNWSDRAIGTSTAPELPVECTWTLTANSPVFSAEVARRTLLIRLNPGVARPESRTDFRHADLLAWTRENRFKILTALYTLVFYWGLAHRPRGKKPMGSYEGFAWVVGGVLENAGVKGFMENGDDKDVAESAAASSRPQVDLQPAVERWWQTFGESRQRASTLVPLFAESGLLQTSKERDNRTSKKQLAIVARLLGGVVGKQVGRYRVHALYDSHTKANEYCLSRAEGSES